MKQYFTSQFKLDKSLMEETFDEYKQWLKTNLMLDEPRTFSGPSLYDFIINGISNKEKEKMSKNILTNRVDTDLVSVNYQGQTYIVEEFETDWDPFRLYPICRTMFVPSPDRLISNMPKDARCKKCPPNDFNIDKVTFNGPKTIVEWKDGTKTIVNCNDEIHDPEKGLAMAIVKKAFGNKGNYYNTFRKAMENARYYNQPEDSMSKKCADAADALLAGFLAGLGLEKKIGGHCEEEKSDE